MNGVKLFFGKIHTTVYFADSIPCTMFLHPSEVFPVWDGPAIFPGEMRELLDAFVVKSVNRISSL